MSQERAISVDVVILGGGVAGLWTLDELRRAGYGALLLEATALGQGQTIWSQGIIHGGLKYTLTGALSPAAEAIRDMPGVWRDCLAGKREPDLSGVTLRSPHCYLWQTRSLMSKLGMIGARVGLRVAPIVVDETERPAALRDCPGVVARLDEQVIEPGSLLAALARRNAGRIWSVNSEATVLHAAADGCPIDAVGPAGLSIRIDARHIVLTAGQGNARLRSGLGLDAQVMQVRPLRMVMARSSSLPELNGHCVDGARTRATITTTRDRNGRAVWQVGGQIAEDGVKLDDAALITHARRELVDCLPGMDFTAVEWAAYQADRAEQASGSGARPDDVGILVDGPVITAWPTKLALAPRLASSVLELIRAAGTPAGGTERLPVWPAAPVAQGPWDEARHWGP